MQNKNVNRAASALALVALTTMLAAWSGASAQFASAQLAPALPVPACPGNPDALGTSRLMMVDATTTPRVGLKQYPATLPLVGNEVVLTFDDGPHPGTTETVLAALKRECVRASFFLVGRNAAAHPELVRRERAEGHTVAYHSFDHPLLDRMDEAAAVSEIDRGIAAVDTALQGRPSDRPQTPFFRFPGFAASPTLLDRLERRGIVVFGADLWASDWNRMTPEAELNLVMTRLAATHGEIILFHDTKQQTAAMLPAFLRALKAGGYRVVHVIAPTPQRKSQNGHVPATEN